MRYMTDRTEYGFLKPEHESFPPIVHVENTNICNIRCIHCPQSDPYRLVPGYKPQSMSTEVFARVVEQLRGRLCALRMTPDGETLLPRDFREQLQMIFARDLHLFAFNTNGLLLEGDILETLLMPRRTRVAVEVSIDALYRDSYDRIRVGSDYDRVMRNVFGLLRERGKRGLADQIKVMVSIVNQPELQDGEFNEFIRFWEPAVDKVIRRTYVDTKQIMPQKQVPGGSKVEDASPRHPCLVPFTRIVVTYDGTVRFCPDDWRKETVIGNVMKNTLEELWRSPVMVGLRQSHLAGAVEHPTCVPCTDWRAIKWGFDYTVALNDLFGEDVV
jgi:radical SAM protein with 4Fe4S-binding SPASM domain